MFCKIESARYKKNPTILLKPDVLCYRTTTTFLLSEDSQEVLHFPPAPWEVAVCWAALGLGNGQPRRPLGLRGGRS